LSKGTKILTLKNFCVHVSVRVAYSSAHCMVKSESTENFENYVVSDLEFLHFCIEWYYDSGRAESMLIFMLSTTKNLSSWYHHWIKQ